MDAGSMDAFPSNHARTEPLLLRVNSSNLEKWWKDEESQVLWVKNSNISALPNLTSDFLSNINTAG